MNIEDLNKTRDLLLKINTLLVEEPKCSEASLDSYKTLTSIVKALRAIQIPNNNRLLELTCSNIIDDAGRKRFQLVSKRIVEHCDFFFEKYNSSKLSEKYSFKNLENILQNLYYSPHFRKEEAEAKEWGRIYNELKNNPKAVQEELFDVLQRLQEAHRVLSAKMSEALLIYNQNICGIISDPYKVVAKNINPLYIFLKYQQNLPKKKKLGRPPKEKAATIYQYFIADTKYDKLKEFLYKFFKCKNKKASPKDMHTMHRKLSQNGYFSKQNTSLTEFAELLVQDTGNDIYQNSISSLYQKEGRTTDDFEQTLKEWIIINKSNKEQ